ncbi:hypothetical protein VP01_2404g6 [Puccinia sorghi]|uniref:Uncharacterized protein n=1 Tax=Puccinia sorghi TaxID=27349 RepID=A0A0L6V7E2_9BASI|nr:hypothetical protein VP01_2404g6 [Puccinia sorghi]
MRAHSSYPSYPGKRLKTKKQQKKEENEDKNTVDDGDGNNHILDLQRNHTSQTANQAYGRTSGVYDFGKLMDNGTNIYLVI